MTALLSKLIIYGKAYGPIADTQFMRDVGWRGGVCPAIAMPESGGMAENVTISETASGHDGSNKPAEETRAHSGLNLSSLAYRAISEMIRDRRLKGGEQIVEARLADALGISRTPLREALQRLEGEGLVRKLANRSYLVRSVDLAEYLHSLKVREILEGEAAVLAIGRIPAEDLAKVRHEIEQLRASTSYHTASHWQSDDNLHGLYINNCGNPVITELTSALRVTTRLFEIAKLKDRLEPDSLEHLAILAALEIGDGKAARQAVFAHIRSLRDFALATVR